MRFNGNVSNGEDNYLFSYMHDWETYWVVYMNGNVVHVKGKNGPIEQITTTYTNETDIFIGFSTGTFPNEVDPFRACIFIGNFDGS